LNLLIFYFNKILKILILGVIYKNAGFSPGGSIERPQEKNLIKFYSYLRIKNFCCNRAYKSYDDFEIAFQLFQEYAESMGFSLYFQDFGQELKIFSLQKGSSTVLHSSFVVQISQCVLRSFATRKILECINLIVFM